MDDPTFIDELKQVFSTLNTFMGYQESKVKDVYIVQVQFFVICFVYCLFLLYSYKSFIT